MSQQLLILYYNVLGNLDINNAVTFNLTTFHIFSGTSTGLIPMLKKIIN